VNRRVPLIVAVGIATLTACGTFEANDSAADVDGTEISRDQYEEVLQALAANSENTQIVADPATGAVPADRGRGVLGLLVTNTANRDFLAAHGESITDADRDAFVATVEGDPLLELPEEVLNELIDGQVGSTARARVAAPDAAELERLYTESPAAAGVMCIRRIVVGSEEAAEDVIDELEAGSDFAALASERSTDQVTAADGGIVTSPEGAPCLPLSQATSVVDPAVATAALDVRAGVPTGPIETAAGWEVIVARPFAEVADALTTLYEERAGDLMFLGFLATSDIEVDPRYGRWDPTGFTVTALA
jgi:parvulin-like peptidyl-prolyl isomerase